MATRTRKRGTDPELVPADEMGGDPPAPKHDLSDEDANWVLSEAKKIFEMGDLYCDADGKPLGLYARLAKIIESLPEVRPEGTNDHFKYKYVTDKQVLGLVRPRLAAQLIVVIPETVVESEPIEMTTQRGGKSLMARLHVVFRVVDGVNGESFTGEAIGYGDDSGDKGANKAYTAALKNFFIKLFLMGGADRDIEDDPETDKRAADRDRAVPPVQSVQVKETVVEGVRRGGRSDMATEAQLNAVSRIVAAQGLTPARLAGAIEIILGDTEVTFANWTDAKAYLSALSGERIGRVIESLSEEAPADEPVDGGY